MITSRIRRRRTIGTRRAFSSKGILKAAVAGIATAQLMSFFTGGRTAQAATLYWDINSTTAGAGGAQPSGTWNTTNQFWNTDSTGGAGGSFTATTTSADTAVFAAGADATGAYTVVIAGTQTIGSITVEEGTITQGTGVLTLSGSGIMDIATGASWSNSGAGTGTIAGTSGLTKNSGGTLFLGGANTFSKATTGAIVTINGGTVDFTADLGLGAVPTSVNANAVTINGGTLRYSATTAATLSVNRGIFVGASGGTIEVTSAASTGLSLPSAASFTLNGSGLLTKTGAGRFTLNTTSNSFTGKYKISAGSISIPGDGRLGLAPTAVTPDYITLDGGMLRSSAAATFALVANRGITVTANGGALAEPGGFAMTVSGVIAGTAGGNLTISQTDAAGGTGTGVGTVVFAGANTYNGSTILTGNVILQDAANERVPDTSVVSINGSASTFDLNGFTETVKSISGTAGVFNIQGGQLIVNDPNGEIATSTLVSTAAGKFIKNGTGTLTLAGSSANFSGEFVANAGKIGVGGSNALGAGAGGSIFTIAGPITLSNNNTTGRTIPSTVSVNLNSDFTVDDSLFNTATPGQILFNGPATIKGSDRTITVNGTANIGFAGGIGQDAGFTRSLTKAGNGTLALNAATTYTGNTNMNGGTLNINAAGTLGDGTGTFNFNGGKLNTTADRSVTTQTIPNPMTIAGNVQITTTSGSTAGASSNLNFTNNNIVGSSGSIIFQNNATTTGGNGIFDPRFSGGNFNLSLPIALNNGASGTVRLNFFNTLGNPQTYSGLISGTGSIRRSASTSGTGGDVIFMSANTFSGGTSLNDGGIGFGVSSDGPVVTNGPIGTGTLTIGGSQGRVFAVGGPQTVANAISFTSTTLGITGANDLTLSGNIALGSAARTFNVDNGGASLLSGAISGTVGIIKTGSSTLTITGTNSYTDTTVNAGTLAAGSPNTLGSGNVSVAGGTLNIGGNNQTVGNVTLSSGSINGATGVLSGNSFGVQSGSVSAILGGTGALTKTTTGTVTLTGANTYSGGTAVNAGTLAMGANNSLQGNLTVAGGTLDISAFNQTAANVQLQSGAINGASGVLTASNYDVQSGAVSANLTGSAALTKSTTGTVTLSGANSYSGGTNVNAGTLAIGANNALQGNLTVAGGTLDISTFNQTAGNVSLQSGAINGSGGVLSANNYDVQSGSISAGLAGTAALTKTTAGVVTLGAPNSYSGGTTITGGTLIAQVSNALPSGGLVTIGSGATLDIGATSHDTSITTLISGSITGTAGSSLNALTFDVRDGSISAGLGGASGALDKTTGGVVNLTGANTYAGGTTIHGGLLKVNNVTGSGTGSGDVQILSGGTLGGTGSIAGNVFVNSGGDVAPGNSIGTITVGGLTLNTGSNFDVEVGAPNSSDEIIVTTPSTGLTLNGGTVNLTDAGGLGVGTYVLIDYNTAFAGSLANLTLGTTPGGFNYALVNDPTATAIDLVVSPPFVGAATWNVDASGNWSVASNWTPGIPDGVDVSATFGSAISAARTVTLDTPRTLGTVNFNNLNSYTLTGSPLTLQVSSGNAAINVLSGSHFIASDVAMASDTTIDTAGGSSLGVSGAISGSNSLTKANAGTLFLSGTNTYTGATNLNGGVVSVGANANLGDPGNALNFAGGTLATTGSFDSARAVTLGANGGGRVDVASSTTTTFSGTVTGTGDLTKTNGGTLVLANSADSFSGSTLINAGTLSVGSSGALGNTTALLFSGSTLATTGNLTVSAPVQLGPTGGTFDTAPATTATLSGAISGGGLNKINAGTLVLSNSGNTYGGGTNLSGGSLISAADNALGTGNVSVSGGSTLDIGASNNSVGGVTLVAGNINGTIGSLNGTSFDVRSGDISAALGGSGTLTKSTTDTVTVSGGNTYTGGTNINAGTLALGAQDVMPSTGAIDVNGGTFDIGGFFSNTGPVTLESGVITSTNGGIAASSYDVRSGTITAHFFGNGDITKTTAGTVTMGTSNATWNGNTFVNLGMLITTADAALPTGALTVNGGTLDITTTNQTTGLVTLTNGSIAGTTGTLFGASYDVRNGSISAMLGGGGSLTKSTTGSVTLSGANTYTGGTNINAGTLSMGAGNVLPAGGAVTINGGLLDVGPTVQTVGAVTLVTGQIGSGGALFADSYDVRAGSIDSALNGTGALTKSTAGVVTLSSPNNYSGGTTITGGTLVAQVSNALPSGGLVTIANGATLDIGATSHDTSVTTLISGSITGTAGSSLSALNFDVRDGLISAGLGGASGALDKTTSGIVNLTGANSYAGGTTIHNGLLKVNNTSGSGTGSGDVQILSGGTLGGSGSIAGNVFVNNGGHLAPGNSIGTITVGGLTLNTGSNFDVEVGTPNSSDETIVTPPSTGLTLNGGTVNLTDVGGMGAGTYVLIDYDTAFAGSLSNLSLGTTPGGSFSYELVNDPTATAIDLIVASLAAGETAWKFDISGNWSPSGNWTNGRPDSADVIATFGNVITADRTVTVDGARTVGTLKFDNSLASYTLTGSQITLQTTSGNAGINVLSGSHTIAAPVAMANDTTVDTASGTSLNISGVLSGSSSLTKADAGTLVLSNGGNSYSGATNLTGGVLQLAAAGALGNTSALNITSATLKTSADMDIPAPVMLNGTGATVDTDPSTVTFSGAVTGTGGLIKINAGTLVLSNSGNTYSGGTTVNGGTLTSAANNALGTGNVTVNTATLDVGASNNTVGAVTLIAGNINGTTGTLSGTSFDVRSGSISAILGGGGALTKTTAGTVTLSGANTYGGGTNVNGGTLALGANNSLPAAGAVSIDNSATLDIGSSSSSAGAVTLVNGSITGTSGVLSGSSYDVRSGTASASLGGGPLAKNTTSTVTLSGSNSYTGGTTLNAGTLAISADNNLGNAAGNVTFGGNSTLAIGGSFASSRNISIASGVNATLSNTGANSFSGTVTSNSGNLTKAGAGAVTLSGVVSGTNGYNVTGGTLALTNITNTVTGPVSVTGGSTLSIAGSGAAGGATGDVTLNGGTLSNTDVTNNDAFLAATRAINIGTNGGTIDVPGSTGTALTYGAGGSILGSGNTVTKTGVGTFKWTSPSSSTYSKLVVTGGLWQGNTDSVFGAVPGSVVPDQITLNGGGISTSAAVVLNPNRGITVGINGGTIDTTVGVTVTSPITGNGALTISGASNNTNITIGNSSNNYTGGTTIKVNTGSTAVGGINILTDNAFGSGKITNVITGGSSDQLLAVGGTRTLANAWDLNGGLIFSGSNSFVLTGPINIINATAGAGRTLQNTITASGQTVTVGATPGSSTITLGNPVSNGGDGIGKVLTISPNTNTTMTINDVMQDPGPSGSGSGTVSYAGQTGGIVVLTGQSTYTGATLLSGPQSIIQIKADSIGTTSGPFGVGTLTPNNSTNNFMQPVGASRTVSNPVSMVTGFTVSNSGTDTFNMTFSGPMTLTSTSGRTVQNNLNAGATLFLGTTGSPSTLTLSSTAAAALTFQSSFSGNITQVNDVIKDGAVAGLVTIAGGNTVIFNAQNTYSGGTSLTGAGTIIPVVLSSNALPGPSFTSGPFGTGTITFNNGTNQHMRPVGNQIISNPILMTTGIAMDTAIGDTTSSLTFAGPITMTNNRFITNGFTAGQAGGTLIVGSASAPNVLTMPATSTFQLSFAALNGNIIVNDTMVNAAGQTDSVSINPNSSDTFAVALNAQNTYTGGTTIGSASNNSAGTVILGVDSVGAPGSVTSGPFGTAAVTMNMTGTGTPPIIQPGGTGAGRTIANAITLTSGFFASNTTAQNLSFTGPMTLGTTSRVITDNMQAGTTLTLGGLPVSQTITASSNLIFQSTLPAGTSGPTIINDVIKDGTAPGSLTAQNNVNLTLATANTYTGNTSILTGATLSVSASNNLGAATDALVFGGGTLKTTASLDNPRSVSLTSTGGTVDTQGNTASFSGVVSGTGALNKVNTGTLVLNNTNTYSGPTSISGGGAVSVGSSANLGDASATNGVSLNNGILIATGVISSPTRNVSLPGDGAIDAGANVTLGNIDGVGNLTKVNIGNLTASHIRANNVTALTGNLAIAPNGGANGVSVVNTLSLGVSNSLDLSDNHLIIHGGLGAGSWNGTAYTGVQGQVISGRNGGTWDGPGLVTTQSAAQNSLYTTLAVAQASDAIPSTATATALWAGQQITGTDTLVMYTYGGDATLDGKINVDDYIRIDSGIASQLTGWTNGDFNLDGKINIDDYTLVIDANQPNQGPQFFSAGGLGGAGSLGSVTASGVSAVPEPSGLLVVGLGALGYLGRRRRKNEKPLQT